MTSQQAVPSPCIDICALDENDICIGCYRHGREISDWGVYSDEQKKEVWQKIKQRTNGET